MSEKEWLALLGLIVAIILIVAWAYGTESFVENFLKLAVWVGPNRSNIYNV